MIPSTKPKVNEQSSQNSQNSQNLLVQRPPVDNGISIDVANQIAQNAAREASRETIENFRSQQEQIESFDDNVEVDIFNPKTTRAIKNTVATLKAFNQEFAPPPNPLMAAIENRMGELMGDFVSSKLSGGNVTTTPAKTGLIFELLNSQFGAGLGANIGNQLPGIITALTGSIGQKRTEELIDTINKKMGNSNSSPQQEKASDNSNVEKQKDNVLALDVNNSEHVTFYAQSMGVSTKAAKEMLQIHQRHILEERRSSGNVNINPQVDNSEMIQAMTVLIKEIGLMKEEIASLKNPNINNENTKSNDMFNINNEPLNKRVNLFSSTPIQVDVDAIKGDNLKESFFTEKPAFEDNTVEKSVEKVKTPEVKKEISKELIKDREDFEKESSEVYKEDSTEDSIDKPKEEPKIEHKKIIRKPLITKKEVKTEVKKEDSTEETDNLESSTKNTETYDIDNNLIKNKGE